MTTIAIVEDNKTIRESLVEFVHSDSQCNCICVCASAEEALETIPKHKPEIVLMDIQLSNMSGIECTAQLKRLLPSLQIIMVTVYEDTERIFKALRAGACGYILKRSKPEQVVAAIHEVREGGAPMSREIARKVISSYQNPVETPSEMEELSPREREILELVAQGFPNKEIASRIGISDGTIRWHLRHVYEKLHVRSRTEAAIKFRTTSSN